ncbi:MAG: hypothetical protein HQK59_01795 [Deltaproteobacteria bacterium]|nr:hypothetical protein [Deltaproteobacteria bacterium]
MEDELKARVYQWIKFSYHRDKLWLKISDGIKTSLNATQLASLMEVLCELEDSSWDKGADRGFTEGQTDGYQTGYLEGHAEGYEQGRADMLFSIIEGEFSE